MKTIRTLTSLILILLNFQTKAWEPDEVKGTLSKTVVLNGSVGMGTFAAGENVGGSVFLGGSVSADWMSAGKTGLSYGFESGLLAGETNGTIIYGIPAIFRLGWYPGFCKNEKSDIFVLAKTGWGFGIWDSEVDQDTKSNGIVGGFNFGGRYYLTPVLDLYSELGYTYYGLARSSNHPEYPLGYGSGKIYASVGLSFKIRKH